MYGIRTVASNVEAVEGADVILLAIKPQMLARVGREIGAATATRPARPLGHRGRHDRGPRRACSATTRSSGACPTRRPGSAGG